MRTNWFGWFCFFCHPTKGKCEATMTVAFGGATVGMCAGCAVKAAAEFGKVA